MLPHHFFYRKTEPDLFLRACLPLGEHEVRMVVIVAGAVATILHKEAVIAYHLRELGCDIAFALLGDSPRDEVLAGLEVVVQALGSARSARLQR